MKSFVSSIFSIVLASSILYAYATLASNSNKISAIEVQLKTITEIREDVKELRDGQREILKILINN